MKSVRVKLVNDSNGIMLIDGQPIPPGGFSEWGINEHSDGQVCHIDHRESSPDGYSGRKPAAGKTLDEMVDSFKPARQG